MQTGAYSKFQRGEASRPNSAFDPGHSPPTSSCHRPISYQRATWAVPVNACVRADRGAGACDGTKFDATAHTSIALPLRVAFAFTINRSKNCWDLFMEIRIATLQDCCSIAEMAIGFRNQLERSLPTDCQFLESISTLLSSRDTEFYIAILRDIPVGYVLQRYRYSMWANGVEATIEDLYVDPGARRGGIGRGLIHFALLRATDQSCKSVCLDTNENNVASTRIYTQLGFNAVSKRWNGRQVFFRLNL